MIGATTTSYTLVAADLGTSIEFEVTPVALTGVSPGTAETSASVGPVLPANTAPTASGVNISGTAEVGQVLTGKRRWHVMRCDSTGLDLFYQLPLGVKAVGTPAQYQPGIARNVLCSDGVFWLVTGWTLSV